MAGRVSMGIGDSKKAIRAGVGFIKDYQAMNFFELPLDVFSERLDRREARQIQFHGVLKSTTYYTEFFCFIVDMIVILAF